MWRILHAFAIAALIGSAAYVYGVKYRTIYASEQFVKTRHLIAKEKDAINLLRAEYAHLARPDRVQALADSKLGLAPLALSQIAAVDELPDAAAREVFGQPYELPLPPHRMNWHAQVLARGARKLGAQPFAPPIAINSAEYDGRPACISCGWCGSGCPTEAKATAANTFLAQAGAKDPLPANIGRQ